MASKNVHAENILLIYVLHVTLIYVSLTQGQCTVNAECRADKGWRCYCDAGFYSDSEGLCQPVKSVGVSCTQSSECQPNAECPDTSNLVEDIKRTCKCLQDFLPNEYGGCECKQSIHTISSLFDILL